MSIGGPSEVAYGYKLSITMVFQHFPPYPGAGSLKSKSVADALFAATPEAGLRVLTTRAEGKMPDGYIVQSLAARHVENSMSLPRRLLGELGLGLRAVLAIRRLRPRPDLLVISSPAYLMAVVTSLWAQLSRIPYVLEVRDVYPEVYGAAGVLRLGSLPYRFAMWLSRRMYRGATAVIAATRGLSRQVADVSGRDDIIAVYNGYPSALSALRPVKHRRFTAGFHGVMGFYQDVETLVQVARKLQPHDVDVVVVGYGRKEGLLQGDVPGNLHFLGRLSFEQTIAEMSRTHVGLCLRTDDEISHDAFPVKLFEYIGLGLPTVVTPACEGGAFARKSGCGVELAAGDADAIVAEVLRLRDDRYYYEKRARACEAVAPQFTRENLSREIVQVILRSAGHGGDHAAAAMPASYASTSNI